MFISFLDSSTRYLDIKLIKHKSEALTAFKEYKALKENNPNKIRIKEVFSDSAKEYIYSLKNYCLENGIIYSNTPPYL